jgi:hypothetical protein
MSQAKLVYHHFANRSAVTTCVRIASSCLCMVSMHDGSGVVASLFLCSGLDRVSAGLILLNRCQGVGTGFDGYDQELSHYVTTLSPLDCCRIACEKGAEPDFDLLSIAHSTNCCSSAVGVLVIKYGAHKSSFQLSELKMSKASSGTFRGVCINVKPLNDFRIFDMLWHNCTQDTTMPLCVLNELCCCPQYHIFKNV